MKRPLSLLLVVTSTLLPAFLTDASTAPMDSPLAIATRGLSDYTDYSTTGLPGLLYVPPDASSSDELRPLILGLDGSGSVGTGNNRQFYNFANTLTRCKTDGIYLYLPQPETAPWAVPGRPELIMSMIDDLIANEKIDPKRIYITGLSMGGAGTWDMLLLFPNRFAAAIVINGGPPETWMGEDEFGNPIINEMTVLASGRLIEGVPVWAFHARDDMAVPAIVSRSMVDALHFTVEAVPPTYPELEDRSTEFKYVNEELNIRYTEFATGGHTIWNGIYGTPEVYEWLFAQALLETPVLEWAGYPVDASHIVNTGDFLGPLQVEHSPWVYSFLLGSWLHLPESLVRAEGAWVYVLR
jgi:predicted peptidase